MKLQGTMEVGKEGHLWVGGCDTTVLAQKYGTPLFVYDEAYLRDRIRAYHDAFASTGVKYQVAYAGKAFCTIAMCQLVQEEGCSLDVVSGGELYTALKAGFNPERIHMHGNNKTRAELEFAVEAGIGAFIVDNFAEIALLSEVAQGQDKTVNALLRIAPGVEAHTHEFISTGQQDSKFGFDLATGQAVRAIDLMVDTPGIRCVGLHAHIGSQIFETEGFAEAINRLAELYVYAEEIGLSFDVLNVGGGFGIRYTEEDDPLSQQTYIEAIVGAMRESFSSRNLSEPAIWIEPGRSIAGPAGITLYTVGTKKEIPDVRNYVAIDGGMTDNPRYALYGSKYEAVLANRVNDVEEGPWTVAGKCCESGDIVLRDVLLPNPQPGDIVAVFGTGAYNYAMISHYNRIPHAAVVFVRDGKSALVVERETWEDVARYDRPLSYDGDGDAIGQGVARVGLSSGV